MKNWHTEKLIVDDTNCDFSMSVSITELMKLFEVATFKHSNKIGLDHVSMGKYSNAFWVVTKMKLIQCSPIEVNDKISVTTWTHELGSIRALRDCIIKKGNSVKTKFLAEWCCLDINTRRLRRMNSINYPELEMEKTNYIKTDFSNIKENVDAANYVYTHTVRSTDIDVNNHTNNLKYNHMAINAFTVEELSSFNIKEYEIYFVNESHEGDNIDVYKKKVKNFYYIEGRVEDKTIFRVVIMFKKK